MAKCIAEEEAVCFVLSFCFIWFFYLFIVFYLFIYYYIYYLTDIFRWKRNQILHFQLWLLVVWNMLLEMMGLITVLNNQKNNCLSFYNSDFEAATANLRCYSQIHEGNFYSVCLDQLFIVIALFFFFNLYHDIQNLIDNKLIKESSHFFGKRWQALFDRYILHQNT